MQPRDSGEDRGTLSALLQTGHRGQKGVSEFNLITWEGPEEPMKPFIQFTLCETKENVSSGLWKILKTSSSGSTKQYIP